MDDALNELGAYLADRLGPAILSSQVALGRGFVDQVPQVRDDGL
jgi:hypothetical protein